MSITIWKPRQYAEGFADNGEEGVFAPTNGEVANVLYSRDVKVREVARFTGSTTQRYRNAGEFEITIPQGYVLPSDVQDGHLVTIGDTVYMIEDYTWEVTEEGYQCTISGRDLNGLLDRHIPTHRRSSGSVQTSAAAIRNFFDRFFTSSTFISDEVSTLLPEQCGWFRDTDRRPADGWVVVTGVDEGALGASGSYELVSYGAIMRIMTGYHEAGYRFNAAFDEALGLHTVQIEVYKPADSGVLLNSKGRGVSGFSYSRETRDEVNAAFIVAKSRWYRTYGPGSNIWEQGEEPIYSYFLAPFKKEGANWAEVANRWRGVAIDLGEVPEDEDTEGGAVWDWMRGQLEDFYQTPTETIEFSYDNSGAYKYGQHFGLGSLVSIADDYTGVGATLRLVGVTTKYEAGQAKGYDFTFGSERITQADKLKSKFSRIDRKTYSV